MKVIVVCGGSEVSADIREYAQVLALEALGPHEDSLLGIELRLSVDGSMREQSASCEVRVAMQPRGAFALSVRDGRLERAITHALADVDSVLREERHRALARSQTAANTTLAWTVKARASAA